MAHASTTGTMGSAIGAVVSRGGNTVELIGQGDAAGPISGEVVVLAVPYCGRGHPGAAQ